MDEHLVRVGLQQEEASLKEKVLTVKMGLRIVGRGLCRMAQVSVHSPGVRAWADNGQHAGTTSAEYCIWCASMRGRHVARRCASAGKRATVMKLKCSAHTTEDAGSERSRNLL